MVVIPILKTALKEPSTLGASYRQPPHGTSLSWRDPSTEH